ncbi:D-galactonate transporter [Pseudomonas sp. JUb42]|uniref:MFS transporter n=1 Tax=Pseudomonas sp. JUb42 TaxID=2940611 RepID=UPI002169ED42|nr:MFS transporter [Pseudomonas sp. JUb42]MCS3472290.1 D-galactonate transporter [Pseudomonas sp. JUb42]
MERADTLVTSLPADDSALRAVYRKVSWRLLPFLLLCYVLAYLDRVNISYAKIAMQQEFGLTDAAYGLAAGIFFIGYVMFEVPSNLWLARVGVRRTLSRIMLLWGATSTAMLFVHDSTSFYVLRFFLGVFEAGFAPGMILYLTFWFSGKRRAQVMACVLLAGPVSNIIGGPLSTWIMCAFADSHGLAGWQWMFILEGAPCIVLGIFAFFFLSDSPAQANWLTRDEKNLLANDLRQVEAPKQHTFARALKDWRVYWLALIYFCLICGLYTVSFWLPTLLRDAGVKDIFQIGLYSMIPYSAAIVAMLLNARSSDCLGERRWHGAVPAFLGAIGLLLTGFSAGNLTMALCSITLATLSTYAAYAVFWVRPTSYLKGTAAAGGIALINSIGAFGGFVSPSIIGALKTFTGSFVEGMAAMATLLVIGGLCTLALHLPKQADEATPSV